MIGDINNMREITARYLITLLNALAEPVTGKCIGWRGVIDVINNARAIQTLF